MAMLAVVTFASVGLLIAAGAKPDSCEGSCRLGSSLLAMKNKVSKSVVNLDMETEEVSGSIVDLDTETEEQVVHDTGAIQRLLSEPVGTPKMEPSLLAALSQVRNTPKVREFTNHTLASLMPLFDEIEEAGRDDTKLRDDLHAEFATIEQPFESAKVFLESERTRSANIRTAHRACRDEESILFDRKVEAKQRLDAGNAIMLDKESIAILKHNLLQTKLESLAEVSKGGYGSIPDSGAAELCDLSQGYLNAKLDHEEARGNVMVLSAVYAAAVEAHENKVVACDEKQGEFEESVCQVGKWSLSACSSYTSAYEIHRTDYAAVADNVASKASLRQVEWTHLKKVHCVLEQLGGLEPDTVDQKKELIEECYEKDFHNPNLIIPERAAPARSPCPAVPVWPCTGNFVQVEYSGLATNTMAAPCETTCAVPTTQAPTPAPTGTVVADSLECTQLVAVSSTTRANALFWNVWCQKMPANTGVIRVDMGVVTDYYKPMDGETWCDMLVSQNLFEWSSNGIDWETPAYETYDAFGGSDQFWPAQNQAHPDDQRKFLSFWGHKHRKGGCCKTNYNSDSGDWEQSFIMSTCQAGR